MENIDKRIIDKGFHTGYEVDFVTIQQSDYEYLKEQSERVQELEEKLHFCEMTKLSMDSVEKYTEQIKSKNKRYHEALVKLRNDIGKIKTGYEKNVFVIKTVDDALIDWEALEGDE